MHANKTKVFYLRPFAFICGSMQVLWRFPQRSGLTILSAALGVAGAVSSINFALGGRQKVIDQLSRLGTNVLIVTPRRSRSVITTLTPVDYASIRREIPYLAHTSAFSTRSFLVKAGDLSKNNCVIAGV